MEEFLSPHENRESFLEKLSGKTTSDLVHLLDQTLISGEDPNAKSILSFGGISLAERLKKGDVAFILERAVAKQMLETVESLLAIGIKESPIRGWGGLGVFHLAFATGNVQMLNLLTRWNLNYKIKDDAGGSPASWANSGSVLAWASQKAWTEGRLLSDEKGRHGKTLWRTAMSLGKERAKLWWTASGFDCKGIEIEDSEGLTCELKWLETKSSLRVNGVAHLKSLG